MVDGQYRSRKDTGRSTQSWATEEESIDVEHLTETMQTFSQDLLELNAHKSNLPMFKTVSAQAESSR